MSKSTVTRLFIGSGIAIVAGAVLFVAAIWLANANDVFVMNGSDIVGLARERAWPGSRSDSGSSARWP